MTSSPRATRYTLSLFRYLILIGTTQICQAQVGQWSAEEIEARNAATGFVQTRAATLDVLRVECGQMMPENMQKSAQTASAWHARNRDHLEAASVWLDQYLNFVKSQSATQYQAASIAISASLTKSLGDSLRTIFKRKPPTFGVCMQALRTYDRVEFDFQNLTNTPGYESFGEFSKTLLAFRASPNFTVPAHIKTDFRPPVLPALASQDAAMAAKELGDGATMREIYRHLVAYGDGQAAQTLGVAYLDGELTPKDPAQAYQWFYVSWSLGNMDGLNALGVLLRDGNGVTTNTPLAYGSFLLAQAGATDQAAYARASNNLSRLQPAVSQQQRHATACTSLASFDAALKAPMGAQPLAPGRSINAPHRKLGQLVKSLADISLAECP